jgi:hypothetical protein
MCTEGEGRLQGCEMERNRADYFVDQHQKAVKQMLQIDRQWPAPLERTENRRVQAGF